LKNIQSSLVDEFLSENKEFMNDEEDSEMPSDYGEEDEESSCTSQSNNASDSQISLSSNHLTTGGATDKGYPFNEINQILKDAKQTNNFMNYQD
jgi:hypothetical protein